MPYAALAIAATTMAGVWMTAKNNNESAVEQEKETVERNQYLSMSHLREKASNDSKSKASPTSLHQTIQNNIVTSSLDTTMCDRRTQVPGGNAGSYYYAGQSPASSSKPSGKPKSVLTQDKTTALVRKHRTLRLLDKFKTQTSVDSKYSWDKENMVGEGAYSKVYQATSKETNEVVALKNISKKYTDSQYFQQEVEAMLYIQEKGGHPHVITLHEHFEDGDFFILILDFIRGGELFDHLIEMGAYSEMDAARIIREVASALLFLHGIGLVHADLKPEVRTVNCDMIHSSFATMHLKYVLLFHSLECFVDNDTPRGFRCESS